MNEILLILGLACMGVLSIVAEPMILIKQALWIDEPKEIYNDLTNFIIRLINCAMCCSFWLALFYTADIITASITSITSELIYRKINGQL